MYITKKMKNLIKEVGALGDLGMPIKTSSDNFYTLNQLAIAGYFTKREPPMFSDSDLVFNISIKGKRYLASL